jgi:hypothetical protein
MLLIGCERQLGVKGSVRWLQRDVVGEHTGLGTMRSMPEKST